MYDYTTCKRNQSSGYRGEVLNGKKHGRGIFLYDNNDYYNGEWASNKKHGFGIYRFNNGDIYEGNFVEGHKHGSGYSKFNNGDTYLGEFYNEVFQGRGVYTYENGSKYIGDFFEGKKHGDGSYLFANGVTYTGKFVNGYVDGEGKVSFVTEDDKYMEFKGKYDNGEFIPEDSKEADEKLELNTVSMLDSGNDEQLKNSELEKESNQLIKKEYLIDIDDDNDLESNLEEENDHPVPPQLNLLKAPSLVINLSRTFSTVKRHIDKKGEYEAAESEFVKEMKISQLNSKRKLMQRLQKQNSITDENAFNCRKSSIEMEAIENVHLSHHKKLILDQNHLREKQKEALQKRLSLVAQTKEGQESNNYKGKLKKKPKPEPKKK